MERWIKSGDLETVIFKTGADKAPVPPSFQANLCSCGAAALKSVLKYWGVFNGNEQVLSEQLNTNCESGTQAKQISKLARKYGLNARIERSMTIARLSDYVSYGIPIICPIQAWAIKNRKYNYQEMLSGHYVVVVGVSNQHVIFQDPLLWGFRGALPEKEFHSRWVDWDEGTEKVAVRWGIPIAATWKPVKKVKRSATKIII